MRELTPRQRDVLELVCEGLDNAEIAERLVVVPKTVKFHLGGIFKRLGARNRTHAAVIALRTGLVE